jgi:hypothetical protein
MPIIRRADEPAVTIEGFFNMAELPLITTGDRSPLQSGSENNDRPRQEINKLND